MNFFRTFEILWHSKLWPEDRIEKIRYLNIVLFMCNSDYYSNIQRNILALTRNDEPTSKVTKHNGNLY
ncbi:hypothetical protein RIR_jg11569.t1 [Rhizophagus irregularis DAOM 181602=DAOM 197198]|nr:hypothetical protein RIR_jg11569.t1 [Rhizophagus irregularis DAOM 181602=DAOM 197198]